MIAAKKLMMMSGTRPFARSGSFETGTLEGWEVRDNVGSAVSTNRARTGSRSFRFGRRGADVYYGLSKREAGGLRISVGAFILNEGSSGNEMAVIANFDDGSSIALFNSGLPIGVWTAVGGDFICPKGRSVSIRYNVGGPHYMDDWSISGVKA